MTPNQSESWTRADRIHLTWLLSVLKEREDAGLPTGKVLASVGITRARIAAMTKPASDEGRDG